MGLSTGTRLGPYEIVGLLGAGGMGEVYRARDPRLGRTVALKVLPRAFAEDPERLRRFEQEAKTASTEPGVVLGTLGYMSPEQLRGQPADARSDLFALGAPRWPAYEGPRPQHLELGEALQAVAGLGRPGCDVLDETWVRSQTSRRP